MRLKRLLRYIGQRGTREGLQLNTEQMNSLHYATLLFRADYPMTPIKWREDCGTLAINVMNLVEFANDFNHICQKRKTRESLKQE